MNDSIQLTQCGQPRAYADSIFAGSVWAESEAEAREKLQAMRGTTKPILDRQGKGDEWSRAYFTKFHHVGSGKWEFRIVEEYTG